MSPQKVFTICTQCKYLRSEGKEWYNNYCGAVINEKTQDPFDGNWRYGTKTDTGRVVITEKRHPHVREVNNGKCMFFEDKDGPDSI